MEEEAQERRMEMPSERERKVSLVEGEQERAKDGEWYRDEQRMKEGRKHNPV